MFSETKVSRGHPGLKTRGFRVKLYNQHSKVEMPRKKADKIHIQLNYAQAKNLQPYTQQVAPTQTQASGKFIFGVKRKLRPPTWLLLNPCSTAAGFSRTDYLV